MPSRRFPLVGSLTDRNVNAALADAKDQQFVNCFPEITRNPLTVETRIWLNKRQGAAASADVSTGATGSYGATVWESNSAAVAPAVFSYLKTGGTNMQFFDTGGTQIGGDVSTTNSCLFLTQTSLSGTGNLTGVLTDSGTGANEAWFFPQGGAWTQITDADFPSNIVPTHAHLDGYMFVMTSDTARVHNSDLNSVSAWTSGNYVTASAIPGQGSGIARYKNLIVAYCDNHTEFYYNAGNATGSVLSRVEDATFRIGALRATSGRAPAILPVGDTVYWIANQADTGARGIYRLNGLNPEKVSSSAIDKLIANGVITQINGCFSLLGMSHIAFGGGSTSLWCYCVDTGYWWVFTPAGSLTVSAMCGTLDSNFYSKSYFSTVTDAKIYTFNPNSPVWQDNSVAYTMTVQTENIDCGTDRRKLWNNLRVVGDVQSSASTLNVYWSDDDYANFSSAHAIDLSASQSRLFGLGQSRRRAWKLTHAANTPCRVEALEIDYTVCTS